VIVATGGIALGLFVGYVFKWIHKLTPDNPTTDTTLTFLTPFITYLLAEGIHVSGVLAVVVAGLFLSWNSSTIFSQQTRMQANGTWNTVIFLLNGTIFIFIGLQLPEIVVALGEYRFLSMLKYGAIISLAAIVGRVIWVYPATYIPRLLSRSIREKEPFPAVKLVTIVAWSGMRGVVSLAAALALPLTVAGSSPFPNRDLIIFLTFCVILATLVLQGLTLRPMITWFGIKKDEGEYREEEAARLKLASSIIEHIEENYSLSLSDEVLNQIKSKYEIRIQRLRKGAGNQRMDVQEINEFHRIQQELLDKERNLVLQLRAEAKISDEAMRRIEYELDLEETRLILERGLK
jgi:monovalent cation/hydrogen antiporter